MALLVPQRRVTTLVPRLITLTSCVDVFVLVVRVLEVGVIEVDDVEGDGSVTTANRTDGHTAQEVLAWKSTKH